MMIHTPCISIGLLLLIVVSFLHLVVLPIDNSHPCAVLFNCFHLVFHQRLLLAALFDNIITFRKKDATIELPTFEAATSGDIRFQFRTTTENGIFLQNTGQSHFIEVKLVCKYASFMSIRHHTYCIKLNSGPFKIKI